MENIKTSKDYLFFNERPQILSYFQNEEKIVFSDTVKKYGFMGMQQRRNFLLTTKYFYNLKGFRVKRKIRLSKILAITVSIIQNCGEFIIHVPTEYDYRFVSTKKSEIIREIQKQNSPQIVKIYGVVILLLRKNLISRNMSLH